MIYSVKFGNGALIPANLKIILKILSSPLIDLNRFVGLIKRF